MCNFWIKLSNSGGKSKLPLDDPKRVLHFGSDAGFGLLQQFLRALFVELLSLARHHRNVPVDLALLVLLAFLYASIA